MLYYKTGAENAVLTDDDLRSGLFQALEKIGKRNNILIIPPDYTRFHSRAGLLSTYTYQFYKERVKDIMPALGTHNPMSKSEIKHMFQGVPENLFRVHDWRNDVITVGEVPASYVSASTNGMVNFPWPAQLNKLVINGGYDLILSIGQVVPHEVIGMANYNKNLFVGTGGFEGINKSHFVGAVYGMERLMGRADNPVRKLLNYAAENFIKHLPVLYVHTVVGMDDKGKLVTRGLFIGDDEEVFMSAAELSLKVNFTMVEKPLSKVVVYLDPSEFKSTWLGNKSIYRTRMALADNAELIVLAPGLKEFGEDPKIDELIRKYGYQGTKKILQLTEENVDLKNNLSAAAHLIHGSSESRFNITYCPGNISEREIRSVNFNYDPLSNMLKKYDPSVLKDGFNVMPDGEQIFYISNPAIGLWAHKDRFIN